MSLWIWYSPGTDEQIEAACKAAQAELTRRGVTAREAQQATFDAAELDETYAEEVTPAADGIVAWYAAEEAAFTSIHQQTGEYPHQASLIYTQDES
jgi:hypothetical protein